jgi:hypothetical protein
LHALSLWPSDSPLDTELLSSFKEIYFFTAIPICHKIILFLIVIGCCCCRVETWLAMANTIVTQ